MVLNEPYNLLELQADGTPKFPPSLGPIVRMVQVIAAVQAGVEPGGVLIWDTSKWMETGSGSWEGRGCGRFSKNNYRTSLLRIF